MTSHAGYRAEERPAQVEIDGIWRWIIAIEAHWREPDHEYFLIRLDIGEPRTLRHTLDADDWQVAGGV